MYNFPLVLAKELAYYRAHFREAVQRDGVICLECGRGFKSLAQHVVRHRLSIHEYKAKWGYNRTTSLVALSTHTKLRRAALAMNLAAFSPRSSIRKAHKAKRGHPWPYRTESRLIQTEAARARLAAGFRLIELKRRGKIVNKDLQAKSNRLIRKPIRAYAQSAAARFKPSKEDLKVLSLRNRGLWPSEIASRLGIPVRSVLWRFERLRRKGFTLPSPTGARPNANRKATDGEILACVRSRLSMPEIAAKVGITTPTVHKRIKRLQERD